MADAAISFLLQDVTLQILGGEDVIRGVEAKLEKLMEEVSLVQAHVRDAASELQAEQLREMDLERQLKEVVYDVEDTIESSTVQIAAAKAKNVCFRQALITELGRTLEREIESIRSRRLLPITRRIKAYRDLGFEPPRLTQRDQVPSQHLNIKVPPPAPTNFVGFEDEAETLISSLMEETEIFEVIAITGMHGIGKTTLASKIYHDHRIRHNFPTRIWVEDFRSRDLYLNILEQGMKPSFEILERLSQTNDDELMREVRRYLEQSKYLLVMDGVWDEDYLKSVTNMLPGTGKVLITSCNNHITRKPHVLRFLNEKESWELLQLEVFGALDQCPETLKATGECIARCCDGLPLAIAAAGNSLVAASSTEAAKNLRKKWWEAVSEDVTVYVTDYGAQHRVLERVESSHSRLHQHLQECFLYMGVFPEGHEIPVRTLARLWIAEGLVEANEGRTLKENADEYLHDLIDTNLVMVVKSYPNGHIKTCRLHKLIHAFCRYKAAEKDLYQEIKMVGDGQIFLSPNSGRLCIYSHLSKFLSNAPKGQRVRSILCFKEEEKVVLHRKDSSKIHECFKLLRVLECRDVSFTRFPKDLSKLIHLRSISLSCNKIRVIPKTISSLRYLETLVVETTQSTPIQLKANIWRMIQLRHLVTKAAIVLAIRGEGNTGENLQILTRLAPACCTEDVFKRARNLKTLGIRGHLTDLAEAKSLRVLEHLENLKLINESAADCQLDLYFFPPNLKMLTLTGTFLKWDCISVLGKIDSLEILKLKNSAFTGESWTSEGADGFRRLGFLLIGATDLVSWEASADCFPSLECLVLNGCEKLRSVPLALAKSLDTLDVGDVSESVVESAKEIQQEIARRQGQNKRQVA